MCVFSYFFFHIFIDMQDDRVMENYNVYLHIFAFVHLFFIVVFPPSYAIGEPGHARFHLLFYSS